MSAPINLLLVAKPATAAAKNQPAPMQQGQQMQQWQQEMARAQGQVAEAQSRNAAPHFVRGTPAAQPLVRHLPAATQIACAKPAAAPAAPVSRAPATGGRGADAAISVQSFEPAIGVLARSATPPEVLRYAPPIFDERHDSPSQQTTATPPNAHTLSQALATELQQLEGGAASQISVGAHLTDEGLAIVLRVQGPLAHDGSMLGAATISFFAQHGLRVATLRCNDQLIFDGRRNLDTLAPVSQKD